MFVFAFAICGMLQCNAHSSHTFAFLSTMSIVKLPSNLMRALKNCILGGNYFAAKFKSGTISFVAFPVGLLPTLLLLEKVPNVLFHNLAASLPHVASYTGPTSPNLALESGCGPGQSPWPVQGICKRAVSEWAASLRLRCYTDCNTTYTTSTCDSQIYVYMLPNTTTSHTRKHSTQSQLTVTHVLVE